MSFRCYLMSLSLALCLLFPAASLAAQVCRNRQDWRQAPTLTVRGDGTVIDARAGLQWLRCAWGQMGRTCSGLAIRLSAAQAHDLVFQFNRKGHAGHRDWRLPSLAELQTLVNPNCVRPAIDLASFPNAPGVPFWSAGGAPQSGAADYVDFESGFSESDDRNLPNAVRLVRSLRRPSH